MRTHRFTAALLFLSAVFACLAIASAQEAGNGPIVNSLVRNNPDAIVDLRSSETARLVSAQWRVHPLELVDVEFNEPDANHKPTGMKVATRDVGNKAGAADFDDSKWEVISADTLETRRSSGEYAGEWYRLRLTLPKTVGALDVTDAVVLLEVTVDDYAEITIDGKLPVLLGGTPGTIAGWNTPQRVVLTNHAVPGQQFTIAILAQNGPLSSPPQNYVWFRSATLDFYAKDRWRRGEDARLEVVKNDPALDSIVAKDAHLERLATGFQFTEGPALLPDGTLLFSDPNRNVIYHWSEDDGVTVYRTKSGYTGVDIGLYHQPGSNGLALDPEGRVTICEHGNRRVTRLEKNGVLTVLADRFEGKRLNSPNDLTYRSDGALFFTDPPFGLPKFHADPRRELDFTGVFGLKDGKLFVVDKTLAGPNGLDFSPDEKFLYVSNWDDKKKTITRYAIDRDGHVSETKPFADLTGEKGDEALDGLEVDKSGNVFVSGPGGVYVFDPTGKKLGKLVFPELPANFVFADADTSTLLLTARTGVYRLHLRGMQQHAASG